MASAAENREMLETMQRYGRDLAFFGGVRTSSGWRWQDSDRPWSYENWAGGQPNPPKQPQKNTLLFSI